MGVKTEFFKLGLDSCNVISPLNPIWENLFTDINQIDRLINIGISAKKYRDSLASYAVNSGAFEYSINDKRGLCMNMMLSGSQWFGEKIKEYDFICSFSYDGKNKQWEYSFYSDAEEGLIAINLLSLLILKVVDMNMRLDVHPINLSLNK